jgi:hypothetical protein
MGFYVRPGYLETIHYYYFSIGIFSLIAAISFGFSVVYSAIFISLYVGQSAFGWYLSWFMQKKMKELVIINSWGSVLKHAFLTFFVGGLTLFLWYMNAFNEQRLAEFMLYVNYFVFFLAVVWYAIMRFGLIKAVFDVYDSRILESAKSLVAKTKQTRKDIFTYSIVSADSISRYKSGSNTEIDEMLMNAWRERSSDRLLRRVADIEMVMCAMTVDRLRRWISQTESKDVITPGERQTITRYEKSIEEYGRSSVQYEKDVLPKIPE